MSIKLVAIDLDGTLLNAHHQITPHVKEAIQYAINKGVYVVLATGRPFSGIQPYLEELGLNRKEQFCISNNGSVIHDGLTGEHLVEFPLSFDDYLAIEQLSRDINISMHALADNKIFTANDNINRYTVHESYITNTPLMFKPVEQMDRNLRFNKIMLCGEAELLNIAESKIPTEFFKKYTMLRSAPFFLECLHHEANKGTAVNALANKLNITAEQIMCIGDQNNDLPMFNYAKHKIAMGNAIDAVKQAATFVTKSNNDDGVAFAIQTFI